ncbi:hypothetical protein SEUCBS139899_010725 [Sporothrix eucalyptigena]
MSADLFAQFGPFSGSSQPANQQQNQGQSQAPASAQQSDDPFAFLSTAFSQPASQAPPQQQPQIQTSQSNTPQPQQWSFAAPAQTSQPAINWGTGSGGAWGNSMTAMTAQPASQPAAQAADDYEDEDTWGDFEEASTSNQAVPLPAAAPQTYQANYAAPPPSRPQQEPVRTRIVRASTMDLISNTLINFGDAAPNTNPMSPVPEPSPKPPQRDPWRNPVPEPAPKPRRQADPNVLFDAEDFEVNGASDDDDFDDDDEFGDFETGHTSPPRPAATTTDFFLAPQSISQPSAAKPAPTQAAATSLMDLLSLSDEPTSSTPVFSMQPQSQTASSMTRSAANLLSPLSFGSTSPATIQAPKSPSFQERNPFPGLAVTTPLSGQFPTEAVKNRTPSPVTTWPSFDEPSASATATKKNAPQPEEADWDAWGVEEPEPPKSVPVQAKKAPTAPKSPRKSQSQARPRKLTKSKQPVPSSDWDWEAEEPSQQPDTAATNKLPPGIANAATPNTISDKAPPPTNVPPPSVLLSLFPTLMALPDEALFKPTASQPAEVRNRVIGDPKTIAFLRNYLQIIVVAGRVIAGRKQRWHRDKFLSQSMSISAAGSSKGGGMKLAGLDKAQGQREDREASDVVAAWTHHVGKLRSAIATANAALVAREATEHKHYPPLKVPEIQSATIPVTVAKRVPTSTKACVICGLRRDERVRGIDSDDVEDIFSEWWVEHWGHRVCRNFWAEHEAALRSR